MAPLHRALLLSLVTYAVAHLALTIGLRVLARRFPTAALAIKPLRWPVNALLLVLSADLWFLDYATRELHLTPYLYWTRTIRFLALVWLSVAGVGVLLFEGYCQRILNVSVPAVLRGISGFFLYVTAFFLVLKFYFLQDIGGIFLAAASLSFVIGIALKEMLGSLFAGISMSIESSFGEGDYVLVGNYEGYIVEKNWRTIRVRSKYNDIITIPNTRIAEDPVVNFYRPERRHRSRLKICIDNASPPNAVRKALEASARMTPKVLRSPAPRARIEGFAGTTVEYGLHYWIEDYADNDDIEAEVSRRLWYRLRRGGLSLPQAAVTVRPITPRIEALAKRSEIEEILAYLGRVPLLSLIRPPDLARLAEMTDCELFGSDEVVFRQGDPGDSFYVVKSGTVDVSIQVPGENGEPTDKKIATLGDGAFFGERSLLTGESRSASVTAASDTELLVIRAGGFQKILLADPQVVDRLSEFLAGLMEKDRVRKNELDATSSDRRATDQQSMLAKIKGFFKLL